MPPLQCAKRATPPRAFTLIELLVVISIIVMLIAILLPALRAARDASKRAACLSNIRQIGIAMTAYAMDENDKYPYLPDSSAQRSWGSYAMTRSGEVIGYGLLYKHDYISSLELYYCPGRPANEWPASYIVDGTPADVIDGKSYPRAQCYVMRGWGPLSESYGEGQEAWAIPTHGDQAIVSDLFLNWSQALRAHPEAMNVGYSDGSARAGAFDTPFPDTPHTFISLLKAWQPAPAGPITPQQHRGTYTVLFDDL